MIATWVLEMTVVIAVSLIFYLNLPVTTSKVLYIPQGSINRIIAYLAYKDLDVTALDGYFLRLAGMPQQGWISIGSETLTHGDLIHKITTAKAAMKDVTLIPGETTYVFLGQLAGEMGLDQARLREVYDRLSSEPEGMLVPNTYSLPLGISEEEAMTLLLGQSQKQMKAWSMKIFGTYNEKKWFQYVTLASVIQKEAADDEDMPMVSSVIHNRLKKGMKLQMDGTLNYAQYSHVTVTADRIRTDTSTYNTYKHAGLPTTPVCNVGLDAIKAAIFPTKSKYLYFVKGKDGRHRYTSYYSTHLRNIKAATK